MYFFDNQQNEDNKMDTTELQKDQLFGKLQNYVFSSDPVTKDKMLSSIWEALTRTVDYNRNNELVISAVKRQTDLIPRLYTILSIQYGAYSYESNISSIFKDIVGFLTEDLDEMEAEIVAYSQNISHPPSFPGLLDTWNQVKELYEAGSGYDASTLPPTPYLAFSLLTLNHGDEVIGKNVTTKEVYQKLSDLHIQMNIIHLEAHRSRRNFVEH